ncbi:hypothetical protein RUND412_000504 [Rhizina undulata]
MKLSGEGAGGWLKVGTLLLLCAFSVKAQGQKYEFDQDFSIGLEHPFSQDRRTIPNFQISGAPQILSDRVVLTPPAPGNQRVGIWSQKTNPYNEWAVDLDFRASGGERPGGSFHFWYTLRGSAGGTGTDSVYTSKPWDGLAIVVDSYGGAAGSVRGYLNDGSTDYSIHHNVPSLAFAHCDLAYRNKGALTKLKVIQTAQNFRVEADGQLCFETNQVRLPVGYYMGVSAATSDTPDSFELFSFLLSAPERERFDQSQMKQRHQEAKELKRKETYEYYQKANAEDPGKAPHEQDYKQYEPEVTDQEATVFKTQEEQFSDLHNRLQALTHHLAAIQNQIGMLYDRVDNLQHRHDDFRAEFRGTRVPRDQIDRVDNRLQAVESLAVQIGNAITSKDYTGHFEALHKTLSEHHSNLLYSVPETVQQALSSGPKISLGITIMIVVQVILATAYVVYKRRRANSPKKYL